MRFIPESHYQIAGKVFLFGYKMRCKSVSSYWINKILVVTKIQYFGDEIVRFQNGCNEVVIELHVVQF